MSITHSYKHFKQLLAYFSRNCIPTMWICLTWWQTLELMHLYFLHLFLPQHGPNILLFTSRYYNYMSLSSWQQWLLSIKTLSWNLKHSWVHLSDWLASEIWHNMRGCLVVSSSVWREGSSLIRTINYQKLHSYPPFCFSVWWKWLCSGGITKHSTLTQESLVITSPLPHVVR